MAGWFVVSSWYIKPCGIFNVVCVCVCVCRRVLFMTEYFFVNLFLNEKLELICLHTVKWYQRVFANGPGDLGSIPGRVIPKTLKMVLDTTLLNTQHYKVRFKGKVEKSWEWSSALPYTLV